MSFLFGPSEKERQKERELRLRELQAEAIKKQNEEKQKLEDEIQVFRSKGWKMVPTGTHIPGSISKFGEQWLYTGPTIPYLYEKFGGAEQFHAEFDTVFDYFITIGGFQKFEGIANFC